MNKPILKKDVFLKPSRNQIWKGAAILEPHFPDMSVNQRGDIANAVYRAMVGRMPYLGSNPLNAPVDALQIECQRCRDLDEMIRCSGNIVSFQEK